MNKRILLTSLVLVFVLATGLAMWAGAEDRAPLAENLEVQTYRGVSVGGNLTARDPDGDPLSFEITTPPTKGTVDLGEDGHFVYTPEAGRRGKDYFGYQAIDQAGNRSQEATVIIQIQKPKSRVTYADTAGEPYAYAAQRLAEEGVYVGACLGGSYVFDPSETVTREEFVALCMLLTGQDAAPALRGPGFRDDAAISTWARGYVSAALSSGVIAGSPEPDSLRPVFRPKEPITMAEAALILDRVMELTDAVMAWVELEDAVPVWARQSAVNLSACGLLPEGCSFADETLQRGDAAVMLVRAMDLLSRR